MTATAMLPAHPDSALSEVERQELAAHEEVVERGLGAFVQVGIALMAIRDGRLYRETHATFDEYVKERWKMSRQRAYQLINAAGVVADLSTTVDTLPANEAQARPLTLLLPSERLEAWQGARELAQAVGLAMPQARHVEEFVRQHKEEKQQRAAAATMPYFDAKHGAVMKDAHELVRRGIIDDTAALDDLPPVLRAHLIWEVLRADDELSIEGQSGKEASLAVSRSLLRRWAAEAIERVRARKVTSVDEIRCTVRADRRANRDIHFHKTIEKAQAFAKSRRAFSQSLGYINDRLSRGDWGRHDSLRVVIKECKAIRATLDRCLELAAKMEVVLAARSLASRADGKSEGAD